MKLLHLGCGQDRLAGFDNLDPKINGWKFENGLPYLSDSVDGITISHALMYVEAKDWPFVFSEFYRVLMPGGVVRITEDDCETETSPRFTDPWPGYKTLTGPAMTKIALDFAGFKAHICRANQTFFPSGALLIAHREYKVPNYVYYAEGQK